MKEDLMCNCMNVLSSARVDGHDIRTQPKQKQTNRFQFIVVTSFYNFSKIMMFNETMVINAPIC